MWIWIRYVCKNRISLLHRQQLSPLLLLKRTKARFIRRGSGEFSSAEASHVPPKSSLGTLGLVSMHAPRYHSPRDHFLFFMTMWANEPFVPLTLFLLPSHALIGYFVFGSFLLRLCFRILASPNPQPQILVLCNSDQRLPPALRELP